MKRYLLLIFLLLVITACAPDPRKEAQAYQTRIEADQYALDEQQNRQHAEEMQKIQVQQAILEEQHREATAAEWRAGLNLMIHYGFKFATFGLCMMIVAFGVSFSWTSIGVARATARLAIVRANLIQLNPTTRQFPLIIQHIHGSRYMLHNPNTGSVVKLDTTNPADRQLIATSGATQIAGVMAQEARQSTDPAGVAIVQPPVVDVSEKEDELALGKDFWNWKKLMEEQQ
jgi:hypothetical protein